MGRGVVITDDGEMVIGVSQRDVIQVKRVVAIWEVGKTNADTVGVDWIFTSYEALQEW